MRLGASASTTSNSVRSSSPLDRFKLVGLRLVGKQGLLATASRKRRHRKPSKLKVTTTTSSTFTILRVSKLKKGKLRFKVKALKVGSGSPKATLTTQVGQLRHR
jgi:hypothetical protein